MKEVNNRKIKFRSSGFVVYVLANRSRKLITGLSETRNVFGMENGSFTKLVYYEKFSERKRAQRRKNYLRGLSNQQLVSVITKKNPEWLNLILTFCETEKI